MLVTTQTAGEFLRSGKSRTDMGDVGQNLNNTNKRDENNIKLRELTNNPVIKGCKSLTNLDNSTVAKNACLGTKRVVKITTRYICDGNRERKIRQFDEGKRRGKL